MGVNYFATDHRCCDRLFLLLQTLQNCLSQFLVTTADETDQEVEKVDGGTKVYSADTLLKVQAMLDTTKVCTLFASMSSRACTWPITNEKLTILLAMELLRMYVVEPHKGGCCIAMPLSFSFQPYLKLDKCYIPALEC